MKFFYVAKLGKLTCYEKLSLIIVHENLLDYTATIYIMILLDLKEASINERKVKAEHSNLFRSFLSYLISACLKNCYWVRFIL